MLLLLLAAACNGGGGGVSGDFSRAEIGVGEAVWTVAVADDAALRSRGLMGVTDLGDLDGMLFVYRADTSGGFWMKDTLIPLDIAFFAADGSLVDLLEMDPCREDPCPQHFPRGPYLYALETERGGFVGVGELVLEPSIQHSGFSGQHEGSESSWNRAGADSRNGLNPEF